MQPIILLLGAVLARSIYAAPVIMMKKALQNSGNNNDGYGDDNSGGDDEDDDEVPPGFIMFLIVIISTIVLGLVRLIFLLFEEVIIPSFKSIRLTNEIPGEFDDEQLILEEDNRALVELTPNEQELYFQTKDYISLNPIDKVPLTLSQMLFVEERGISAWEFKPNGAIKDEIMVANKTELNFNHTNPQSELSIQTNFPIPKTLEVYYFELKIMSLPKPEETLMSFGISTSPYPYFRLPGRHRYSISYDSNGDRRYNQMFPLKAGAGLCAFPKISNADVIGVGYRTRTGSVFFTRNGKKVSESKIGGHIQNFKPTKIFPTIGSTNECSIHINLGQSGFVFIEANVKKWGFAPLEGNGPPPPAYKTFNEDVLLESSSEYSDGEDSFPPDFWNATQASFTDIDEENITLNTLPNDPPLYRTDSENSFSGGELGRLESIESNEDYNDDADDEDNSMQDDDDDEDDDENSTNNNTHNNNR